MTQFPLPPEIRSLPVPERLDLVEQIWDSIVEDQEQFELSDAQKAELDRRLAAHKASPESGSTWEEVEERLRNRR
jgi:putative addiction module component (TIGR02574 family)